MNDKPTRWDYVTAAIITILCACWTVFEYYINPDKIPFEPIIALVAGLFAIWGIAFGKGKKRIMRQSLLKTAMRFVPTALTTLSFKV
jgi:CHASE2 domain-containing sensor protein